MSEEFYEGERKDRPRHIERQRQRQRDIERERKTEREKEREYAGVV